METTQLIKSLVTSAVILLTGCASDSSDKEKIREFDDLAGKKIVVQEGTIYDEELTRNYPSYNITRVQSIFDIYKALVNGEADYGIDEDITCSAFISSGLSIDTAYANIPAEPLGAIFNKSNTSLQSQFNDFIDKINRTGELTKIRDKWFNTTSPSSLPIPECTVTSGEPFTVITEGDYPPFNFSIGNKISGFEAELITMFANSINRPVKMIVMPFSDIIDNIAQGKNDMGISGITINDERASKVLFSKPYSNTYTIIVRIKKDTY